MITIHTAGESHGPAVMAIVEGLPRGLAFDEARINRELQRRQGGYGRGGRMRIEQDAIRVLSGVRHGQSTGAPITMMIENRDNRLDATPPLHVPRPGHGDLAGCLKFGSTDARDVLERASARETAARVMAGAACRLLLEAAGIHLFARVLAIGGVRASDPVDWLHATFRQNCAQPGAAPRDAIGSAEPLAASATDGQAAAAGNHPPLGTQSVSPGGNHAEGDALSLLLARRDASPFYGTGVAEAADPEQALKEAVDAARLAGDTLGGEVEVVALGLPPGLGSVAHYDRKLDGRIARDILSVQAIKALEFGDGCTLARVRGSSAHDPIVPKVAASSAGSFATGGDHHNLPVAITRGSNHAGGLEAGMSNGMPLVLRATMKPIATLMRPLPSVDLPTGRVADAARERSDVCAVPAASVVLENVLAVPLAQALLEKFGGDSLEQMLGALEAYRSELARTFSGMSPRS